MMHYFKTGPTTISDDLIKCTKDSNEWCPFLHGKMTDYNCYKTHPEINSLITYLKKYALCYEFLDIDVYSLRYLNEIINCLEKPDENPTYINFKKNIRELINFIKFNNKLVYSKIILLTCEESTRLDEALNTYNINSFFSSIVMAVSAVESRLHYLVQKKNKTIYNKYFKKATLGQLIQLFDKNSYQDNKFNSVKKVLPEKYKPLIQVLNYYRIFSAHAKTVEINYKIAQSILNFSFSFLLNKETKIDSRLTKCS